MSQAFPAVLDIWQSRRVPEVFLTIERVSDSGATVWCAPCTREGQKVGDGATTRHQVSVFKGDYRCYFTRELPVEGNPS